MTDTYVCLKNTRNHIYYINSAIIAFRSHLNSKHYRTTLVQTYFYLWSGSSIDNIHVNLRCWETLVFKNPLDFTVDNNLYKKLYIVYIDIRNVFVAKEFTPTVMQPILRALKRILLLVVYHIVSKIVLLCRDYIFTLGIFSYL